MLLELSPEQEQLLIEVRNQWLGYIFSPETIEIDKEKAIEGINWLYEFSGLSKPKIIFVQSPKSCQIVANFLNSDKEKRRQMLDSEDLTGNKRLSYFDFSYYGNISDYGWVAQIDFYTRIGIVKNKDYEKFKALLQTGVYDMIQLKDYCIVSAKPTKIVRNNDNRLDNRNGPAIEFGDGYKQYYINGRAIPEWVFQKVEAGEITREMYLSEKNMEIKSAIYEVMGQQKMMDLLGAEVVDTKHIVHRNGDIETVWLLKTKDTFEEIGDVPFAWVKMICPSTGTVYLGGCDSGHTCAREAMASISPFKPEDYSFDFRS